MNRQQRRALSKALGVPGDLILGVRPDGLVEVCTDGSCTHQHRS